MAYAVFGAHAGAAAVFAAAGAAAGAAAATAGVRAAAVRGMATTAVAATNLLRVLRFMYCSDIRFGGMGWGGRSSNY
ncbi:hypothetical protein Ssi02_64890 [Sinosporangium siamense]|uniref:Secreted protein n=1 Tax=Sinosporangium siamense TaxID=1367973 RepID=A0A919VAB3_9ACTN|nr:hypothetical protein Ssi02_64890 [Sinosporangium siamense]